MAKPIMSTKAVAMSTPSCRIGVEDDVDIREQYERENEWFSAAVALAPEQESGGRGGHQQHAVDRRHPELLAAQALDDLHRDGAGFEGVEDDRDDEIAERGDEGQAEAGGERRPQERQDDAEKPRQRRGAERRRG